MWGKAVSRSTGRVRLVLRLFALLAFEVVRDVARGGRPEGALDQPASEDFEGVVFDLAVASVAEQAVSLASLRTRISSFLSAVTAGLAVTFWSDARTIADGWNYVALGLYVVAAGCMVFVIAPHGFTFGADPSALQAKYRSSPVPKTDIATDLGGVWSFNRSQLHMLNRWYVTSVVAGAASVAVRLLGLTI